ncbi:DUF6714 family protein [uncultured Thiothrix sp.]|uniref:DUF6714 family protein n=1 Tax=uncultured Thiothrix sp. TaxID=223185 RepID=UPI002626F6AB|nr:DUF6714 family protein [uncultured Thiothrix sp.]
MTNSSELERLQNSIFTAFGSIPFPRFGLKAARALDDWITDEDVLTKITLETDIHGEWWEIPAIELETYAYDAMCYLEPDGMLFYIPAYLNNALNTLKYSALMTLIFWMTPWKRENSEDEEHFQEMYSYFCSKFSKFTNTQKQVCKSVLSYFVENSNAMKVDEFFTNQALQEIQAILRHDYWKVSVVVDMKTLQA